MSCVLLFFVCGVGHVTGQPRVTDRFKKFLQRLSMVVVASIAITVGSGCCFSRVCTIGTSVAAMEKQEVKEKGRLIVLLFLSFLLFLFRNCLFSLC